MDDSPRDVSTYVPPSPLVQFKTRKKRYYFREGDDIVFLQTVLNEQRLFSLVREYRGILASTHSLCNRLKRLVENLHERVAGGKTTADFTALEHLLAKYAEAEAQYLARKATGGLPVPHTEHVQSKRDNRESRQESLSIEAKKDLPHNILVPPFRLLSPVSASVKSVQAENVKKSSFVFQEWHDELLLQAMLVDQGTVAATGRKKPDWDDITASLNDHGLCADTRTLRKRLQLLQARIGDEAITQQGNVGNKRPLPVTKSAESVRIETSEFVTSHESSQAQDPERTSAAPEAIVEPTIKKQKQSCEVILERFVKHERQKEQHDRARFSTQQEFQQQTIDLQRRALDIQDKALAMQSKLMELMEKVVNKL